MLSLLRPALSTAAARNCRVTRPCIHRNFTFTRPARATESSDTFVNAFKGTSIFRQLADQPEALAALTNLGKLLEEAGLDLRSGRPPSSIQMMKLAMNPSIRDALKKVAEEMERAGVDFKSKEVMDEILSIRRAGGTDK